MVDQINNGEEGYSVREKLNTVIDRTNTLNGIENQVETNKQNIAKNTTEINELWEHVDDVEDTIQDLDVSVLDGKIDKEIQDRIDGDQNLQDQIEANDTNLQGQIDDLVAADAALTDAIIFGDAALQGQIDAIVAELGEGGAGAGLVISPTEPTEKVEGMQWLDSTTAIVWIWDGEKWLEFPAKGEKGEKGEDGAPGSADMPPYDYEFTPDTLVLRDGSGNLKGKKVIAQQLQMTTGGTSNITPRPNDTIFYSSTSNQLYKNSKEGMRAALGITGDHESANKGQDYRYELDQISDNLASRPGKMNLNNANPESVTRISFYVTDADSRPMPHVAEGYFVEFSHDDGDVLYKVTGAENAQFMVVEWVSGDMVFQETVTYQANVYPLLSSLWNGDDFMITGTYHSKDGNFVGEDFGLKFDKSNNSVVPIAANGNPKVGIDLGSSAAKFKDGEFTGDVGATSFKLGSWAITLSAQGNLEFEHSGVSVMTLMSDGTLHTKQDVKAYSDSA